jgi:hypothetical protein
MAFYTLTWPTAEVSQGTGTVWFETFGQYYEHHTVRAAMNELATSSEFPPSLASIRAAHTAICARLNDQAKTEHRKEEARTADVWRSSNKDVSRWEALVLFIQRCPENHPVRLLVRERYAKAVSKDAALQMLSDAEALMSIHPPRPQPLRQ